MTMQQKQNKLQKSRRLCNDTDKGVTKKYIDKIFDQQMTFLSVYQVSNVYYSEMRELKIFKDFLKRHTLSPDYLVSCNYTI